ncbi:hypothetical protein CDL12_01028 [Handroanthus impetiginosus]|uniref:Uncharacterized protein n=1 Tax=Handroanthus impetiginosus TaxID=429701 RepID=A0A2G9I8Z1_9LAMI|nr:hypothetical protein CDL12_01028 [Handroanthus impetiginosus]
MVKYAGENIAKHFGLSEARDLFHNVDLSSLQQLRSYWEGQISMIDKAGISDKYKDLFVALRSSYLTFRTREEHIVEAYSPHRFSRQHGFCQDTPGTLRREILSCELNELVRLWASSTLLGTSSKLTIPGDISSPPLLLSTEKEAKTTSRGSARSVNEASLFDFVEENMFVHRNENNSPAIQAEKDLDIEILPNAFEVSSCPHPVSIASEFWPQAIKTATEQLLLIKEMEKHMGDISVAKSRLAVFFDRASDFIEVKLSSASKKTLEMHETSLSFAQQNLLEAESRESKEAELMQNIKAELLRLTQEKEELKRQLAKLGIKKGIVNLSFGQTEESLSKSQEDVVAKREIVLKIESEPYLWKKDTEALEKMEVELENSRRDLASFNLFV